MPARVRIAVHPLAKGDNVVDQKQERKLLILDILRQGNEPLTSALITEGLATRGIEISERTVRLYLQELDGEALTENLGKRGRRITEILKQGQYSPMEMEKQVMVLYAAINGYLDDIEVEKLAAFETEFHRFIESSHPEIGVTIAREKDISPETENALKAAIEGFKRGRTT